jgi:hypothetical protein
VRQQRGRGEQESRRAGRAGRAGFGSAQSREDGFAVVQVDLDSIDQSLKAFVFDPEPVHCRVVDCRFV